jgi:hypothetical protein
MKNSRPHLVHDDSGTTGLVALWTASLVVFSTSIGLPIVGNTV